MTDFGTLFLTFPGCSSALHFAVLGADRCFRPVLICSLTQHQGGRYAQRRFSFEIAVTHSKRRASSARAANSFSRSEHDDRTAGRPVKKRCVRAEFPSAFATTSPRRSTKTPDRAPTATRATRLSGPQAARTRETRYSVSVPTRWVRWWLADSYPAARGTGTRADRPFPEVTQNPLAKYGAIPNPGRRFPC
jgi:hypothetical protein